MALHVECPLGSPGDWWFKNWGTRLWKDDSKNKPKIICDKKVSDWIHKESPFIWINMSDSHWSVQKLLLQLTWSVLWPEFTCCMSMWLCGSGSHDHDLKDFQEKLYKWSQRPRSDLQYIQFGGPQLDLGCFIIQARFLSLTCNGSSLTILLAFGSYISISWGWKKYLCYEIFSYSRMHKLRCTSKRNFLFRREAQYLK
jgi:hypothetical protein